MGATLIVDDPELAPILSSTHQTISEGWKTELAQQQEEVGRSGGITSTGNRTQVTRMVAQCFTRHGFHISTITTLLSCYFAQSTQIGIYDLQIS